MAVRGKFQVQSITQHCWSKDARTVKLAAVTSGSEENKTWATYTPSGSIEMQIDNPEAADQLAIGKEFYVDFTPADAQKAE